MKIINDAILGLKLFLDNNVLYSINQINTYGKIGIADAREVGMYFLNEGKYRFYVGNYYIWLTKESINDVEYFPSDDEIESITPVNETIHNYWHIDINYDHLETITDIIPNNEYYLERQGSSMCRLYIKELTNEIEVIIKLLGYTDDFRTVLWR